MQLKRRTSAQPLLSSASRQYSDSDHALAGGRPKAIPSNLNPREPVAPVHSVGNHPPGLAVTSVGVGAARVCATHGGPLADVGALQATSFAARVQFDQTLVRTQQLHPANASHFVACQGPRRAVVLGLHGFAAGPWQYDELSGKLAKAGFDVFVPRMVGHGQRRAGQPLTDHLPDSTEDGLYSQYVQNAFANALDYAHQVQAPLHVVGHSMGGALARELAATHEASIGRVILIAPLMRPTSWRARLKFLVARLIHRTTWGRRWLQSHVHTFVPDADHHAWPAYPTVPLNKIFPVLNYARKIWGGPGKSPIPALVFVSEADQTCDARATQKVAPQHFSHCTIHRFVAADGVGHAMISEIENPGAGVRAIIGDKTTEFLIHGSIANGGSIENMGLPPAA